MKMIVHVTYEIIADCLHVKIAEVVLVIMVLQQWNLVEIPVMTVEMVIGNQSSTFTQLQKHR
jgi:hypothetical protein